MPPFVPRKRLHTPPSASIPKHKKKQEVLDGAETLKRARSKHSAEDNQDYLQTLQDDEDLETGTDSDVDSDDFEDAMPGSSHKRRKTSHDGEASVGDQDSEADGDDWEDAIPNRQEPTISGDFELTLDSVPSHSTGSLTNPLGSKKGPSKIERIIRYSTHCMHVQCLMHYNMVRNGWISDKKVQKILVDALLLNSGMKKEVEKWEGTCATETEVDASKPDAPKSRGKAGKKAKAHRDWGEDATSNITDSTLSSADQTVRLLKALSAYWRKKFTVTAPGLRKQGYKDAARLDQEMKSLRNSPHDHEVHGETIQGRVELRKLAKTCTGSRDVGAQLFTALLRGLGVEARMVASLQPIGFGWSKIEEALPAKKKTPAKAAPAKAKATALDSDLEILEGPPAKKQKTSAKSMAPKRINKTETTPIILSDDSELSMPPASDDESLLDITPPSPPKLTHRFDRDLVFPVYWTEALSTASNTWIPVDPLILNLIATKDDDLLQFEPRGAKADKGKQVLAYVVGFSADGTAKDVTTRYLKKHVWPGKTKGMRLPVEKRPIYNRRGKVTKYREYDWFGNVMQIYQRPRNKRTVADDIEEARELKPVRVQRQVKEGAEETLQGYKSSAEFVLERFLRREEALLPGAEQVKTFKTGKGDNEKEEPVFQRSDVVTCKTVESWHKEGRMVQASQQPLKWVAIRAVTTVRKREIEEAERESGEKQKQGLYSRAQTQWIVPDPIVDGKIPKNAFGNMDVYVPTMVPAGAVHLPYRGTAKICKRLGVEFAEACTGFEFGNRRAVPVLTGVVVAKENRGLVYDAWRVDEKEKSEREAAKREKLALGMWKKMLAGLRVIERVKKQYGDEAEGHFAEALDGLAKKGKRSQKGEVGKPVKSNGNGNKGKKQGKNVDSEQVDVGVPSGGGGFILDGATDEADSAKPLAGGFFLDGEEDTLPKTAPAKAVPARRTSPDNVDTANGLDEPNGMDDLLPATRPGSKPALKVKAARTKKPKAEATSARKSGRSAARKSAEAVRSHYFEQESEDDDE